jgi:hypothetical protein
VNDFVANCRREWRRLGVPDPVADEMAAELEADLMEAEAEGVSADEVLGSGADDPRAFAAAWAAERGVIENGRGLARRAGVLVAIAAFALIAVIGGVLVTVASPSGPTSLAFTAGAISPDGRTIAVVAPPGVRMPAPQPGELRIHVDSTQPRIWISPVSTLSPVVRIVAVDVDDSGIDTRALGWVLLAFGLAGAVPLTTISLWPGRPRGRR